jgi:hypothetical protein
MALKAFLLDGEGYPTSIQLLHAVAACTAFRASFSPTQYATLPLYHRLIGAYFCHGYGGSTCRDLLLGRAPSLAAHPTVAQHFLAGWLLANRSPGDAVWRGATERGHPLRVAVQLGEAVDAATTVCGAFEKGAAAFPAAPAAPFAAALAAVLGGGVMRYLERRGRGLAVKTEWCAPTPVPPPSLAVANDFLPTDLWP